MITVSESVHGAALILFICVLFIVGVGGKTVLKFQKFRWKSIITIEMWLILSKKWALNNHSLRMWTKPLPNFIYFFRLHCVY